MPLPFPGRPGLVYFWFLNDECRPARMEEFLAAFARPEIAAVCLHPRDGLLLPYGGGDWFDFVRDTVAACARRNVRVWLYDEDPYPSGAAGGRIVLDHPEWEAQSIEAFTADPALAPGELFTFPTGRLLWCGLVRERDGHTVELTGRVGMVRRAWKELNPWDSRWYYPATPLHSCPRAMTGGPEHALRVPAHSPDQRLMAFVARPCGRDSVWGALPDSLNPEATRLFIQLTHERYRRAVGEHFGRTVEAIFTDEPKCFGHHPWTPGLFEDFASQAGYDLPRRLWRLFSEKLDDPETLRVRLDYRQWCSRRFEEAWLRPVADWCRANGLPLVGHISPEDDPVQQAACVGNLLPLMRHFHIPGIDLIIPAVGDREHPLINLGVITAVSVAQQTDRPGVMSETLACSGLDDFPASEARRILLWQAMMGVTTTVVHGAFNSMEGLRRTEAPPDFGPASVRWEGMMKAAVDVSEVQRLIAGKRQVAPVALLWPIRSFTALIREAYAHDCPLRDEFVEFVRQCLDRQVGLQFLDEATLREARPAGGELRIGRARYSHVVLCAARVLHADTLAALRRAGEAGVRVLGVGTVPEWVQSSSGVAPAERPWWPVQPAEQVVDALPRLVTIALDGTDVRCTAWQDDRGTTRLLLNLRREARSLRADGQTLTLPPDTVAPLSLT
jgi:hypothetical protein